MHTVTGGRVELHDRLTDNPNLLPINRCLVEEEAQAFEPRSFARPFAGRDDRPRSAVRVPGLRRRQVRPDRRGRARGARIRPLPLQARRARAAEDELPGVRDRRPGADADAADREGASGSGAARPCRRVEVLRSSAAASSGRHLSRFRQLDRRIAGGDSVFALIRGGGA